MCLYVNFKDKIEWVKFTFVENGNIIRPYRIIEVFKVCRRLNKILKNMNEVNKCKLLLEIEVQGILE
jgi:hypothetical protein